MYHLCHSGIYDNNALLKLKKKSYFPGHWGNYFVESCLFSKEIKTS